MVACQSHKLEDVSNGSIPTSAFSAVKCLNERHWRQAMGRGAKAQDKHRCNSLSSF